MHGAMATLIALASVRGLDDVYRAPCGTRISEFDVDANQKRARPL